MTDTHPNGQPRLVNAVHTATAVIDNGERGTREITFETGRLARQAAGSAVARFGDTMILSATTAGRSPRESLDFFPLTVDVEEKLYSIGRIPGSFFRREGRPSEDAILTCRLIDRPLRPSFVKGLRNEVQVVVTVLSLDPDTLYDVLAINAASLSTQLAGLPFSGPIGATRVAFIRGQWVAFPSHSELEEATFDMVVAGRVLSDVVDSAGQPEVAIMMVEAEATPATVRLVREGHTAPTEDVVAAGLEAAKPAIRALCAAQVELAGVAAKPTGTSPGSPTIRAMPSMLSTALVRAEVAAAVTIVSKADREAELDRIGAAATEKLGADFAAARGRSRGPAQHHQGGRPPPDRRDGPAHRRPWAERHRPLAAEVGILPLTHGSALFERGETQVLGVTTLNMLRLEQIVDTLPRTAASATCTTTTCRRTRPVRPAVSARPSAARSATARSRSARSCRFSPRARTSRTRSAGLRGDQLERLHLDGLGLRLDMSLMHAACPLAAPVAGIAMGWCTRTGPTSTRRTSSAPRTRSATWTSRSRARPSTSPRCSSTPSSTASRRRCSRRADPGAPGASTILEVMATAITEPSEMRGTPRGSSRSRSRSTRSARSSGPKGKMINEIQETTGADITVEDDGTIFVGATEGASAQAAVDRINAIANPILPMVGERYQGTVVKTTDFGAFVSLTPGKDGLVHISKLGGGKRIERVEEAVKEGDDDPRRGGRDRRPRQDQPDAGGRRRQPRPSSGAHTPRASRQRRS